VIFLDKYMANSNDQGHVEWVNRNFYNAHIDCYDTLDFGELAVGDKFIFFPQPGDNSGHGGFRGAHYICEKLTNKFRISNTKLADNYRDNRGIKSNVPLDMPVIRVL
jgi:hypothetical protein